MYWDVVLGFFSHQDIYGLNEIVNQQADAFKQLWQSIGESKVLAWLISTSRFLVVGSLAFYAYQLYKKFLDELDWRPTIQAMILPFVLLFLLGSPTAPEKSFVWVMGSEAPKVIRRMTEEVAVNFVKDVNLFKESQKFRTEQFIKNQVNQELTKCARIDDLTARDNCYRQVAVPLKRDLDALKEQMGATIGLNTERFYEEFTKAVDALQRGLSAPIDSLQKLAARTITDMILDALATLIGLVGWVTGYCVEVALIVAALLGPLAMGFSLLPLPTKPVYAWGISYIGIAVFRITFSLMIGLSAYVMNRVLDFTDSHYIVFAIITGLFAPLLASQASSWSTSSILQGTNQAISSTWGTVQGIALGTVNVGTLLAVRGLRGALAKGRP